MLPSLLEKGEEKVSLKEVHDVAVRLLLDCQKKHQVCSKNNLLLQFQYLVLPAMSPKLRKESVQNFLKTKEVSDITTIGVFAWAVSNFLNEFREEEKVALEEYFAKCEEYFDGQLDKEGLLPSDGKESWLKNANRNGILLENQAFYMKILELLYVLSEDEMYLFKKKRLVRAVRDRLDGAFVLDRGNSLEVRPTSFMACFFSPGLFRKEDWEKSFDAALKESELWISWGGLRVLSKGDPKYNPAIDGESWFFINIMAAIVLERLDHQKYSGFIAKSLVASANNILWQEHAGRACEVVFTEDKKIKVKALSGISAALFIYLYKMVNNL